MNRDQFRLITEIAMENPWIDPEALSILLFNDCRTSEERDLVIDLIGRFLYLETSDFENKFDQLADQIVYESGYQDNETQIVAMAADSGSDSSHVALYALKVRLQKRGWIHHTFVNKFSHSYKTYRNNNNLKKIVLVDEFIGSGQTAIGRVNTIRSVFSDHGIDDIEIQVRSIISTSVGLLRIRELGVIASSITELEKGISDYFPPDEVREKINTMLSIESLLSTEVEGRTMPSMGYGGAEALYARHRGNTPNSVFPIFWWPCYQDLSLRETLLHRAIGDA